MAVNESTRLPFAPECEVLLEGGPDTNELFKDCPKNPGHPTFIPLRDVALERLPPEWRTQKHLDSIRYWCDLTVKVLVSYTSQNRPDTYPGTKSPYPYIKHRGNKRIKRIGTGCIDFLFNLRHYRKPVVIEERCPCRVCCSAADDNTNTKTQPKMKYLIVYVITATHVVYDNDEAAKSVFECFYDSEDNRDRVKCLYGLSIMEEDEDIERYRADTCKIKCVTHDEALIDWFLHLKPVDFSSLSTENSGSSHGIIISHPHGRCKHVTIGEVLYSTVPMHSSFPTGVRYSFGKLDQFRLPNIHDSEDEDEDKPSNSDSTTSSKHAKKRKFNFETEQKDDEPIQAKKASGYTPYRHVLSSQMTKGRVFQIPDDSPESSEVQDVYMKPGVEYYLPYMTFEIPNDSFYFYRITHPREINISNAWFRFPPETKLFVDDEMELFVPPEMEFKSHTIFNKIRHSHVSFGNYRIDTCPGSSGAPVFYYPYKCDWLKCITHAGGLDDGTNRSNLVQISGV